MSEKLTPCPFCGSDDVGIGPDTTGHWIGCRQCYAVIRYNITPDTACAAWNKRDGE